MQNCQLELRIIPFFFVLSNVFSLIMYVQCTLIDTQIKENGKKWIIVCQWSFRISLRNQINFRAESQ